MGEDGYLQYVRASMELRRGMNYLAYVLGYANNPQNQWYAKQGERVYLAPLIRKDRKTKLTWEIPQHKYVTWHYQQHYAWIDCYYPFNDMQVDRRIENRAGVPIPTLIERHALFRKLCFDYGLRIDYTEYDHDLFIDKCLRDESSWLHSLSRWLEKGVEYEECVSPRGETYYVPIIRHLDFYCWMFSDQCRILHQQSIHDMLDPALPEWKRGNEYTDFAVPAGHIHDCVGDAFWIYGYKFDTH
jgi:hypothetical protein